MIQSVWPQIVAPNTGPIPDPGLPGGPRRGANRKMPEIDAMIPAVKNWKPLEVEYIQNHAMTVQGLSGRTDVDRGAGESRLGRSRRRTRRSVNRIVRLEDRMKRISAAIVAIVLLVLSNTTEALVPPKEPLLFAAVYSGSTNVLQFLVEEGATTKSRDSDGETLLHHAILFRQTDMGRYLVRLGLDVNAVDKKGLSPLHAAAYVGDVPIIEDLARAGANVNATNWHKEAPLHIAAVYDHTNSVRELLHVGANPNLASDEGDTPLCQAKSSPVVELLLQAKADPNIGNHCAKQIGSFLADRSRQSKTRTDPNASSHRSGASAAQ